ncbi:NADH-FMN oxidoreductase RutF, flavin reductase (DIM6/NTAB) family [Pseudoxanthobacter soli DSM 19599]|uniref:NADH-FMN oxidoreductase RutF, flavin reductase (DIM6/NTAB) family n=2 Tax=Pseudoxanthobacter TaxID=433838 RepID=A0A1M7ZQY2_9HYPH|nr:NADH-FMN oxidoreductase RutF, flavin reductase (DIM6/NTAB) family [Pseudoxanthobacter soli DSM 19599]
MSFASHTSFASKVRVEADANPTLKQAMRHLVGGVSVVTAGTGDDRTGATVTSAHSLSVDPETMVVSINKSSSTWPVIARNRHFCVNVLAADQQAVAERFAGYGGLKGAERYRDAEWSVLVTGALALSGALAAIDCELDHVVERHSHALVIGTVRALVLGHGQPLVYHNGRFGAYA